MSEYIYKNSDDTVRVKVFSRDTALGTEWDFDVFTKTDDGFDVTTFSEEAGDLFVLRRDGKEEAEHQFGKLKSINPEETVTSGW